MEMEMEREREQEKEEEEIASQQQSLQPPSSIIVLSR